MIELTFLFESENLANEIQGLKISQWWKLWSFFTFLIGMYQFYHLAILGRDNSFMSGEAANKGIENSLRVRKGTFQFPHEWHSRRGE